MGGVFELGRRVAGKRNILTRPQNGSKSENCKGVGRMVESKDALETARLIAGQCDTDLTEKPFGLSREVVRANAQVGIIYVLIAVAERLDKLTHKDY